MPIPDDRAVRRTGRDRDVLPLPARRGPYEAVYDVRRGYEQPSPRRSRRVAREAGGPRYLGREGERDRE